MDFFKKASAKPAAQPQGAAPGAASGMSFGLAGGAPQGKGGGDSDLIKETTTQTFMKDVIEASKTTPVLVDFWAPWCGPCKQLTPVLEKVVRAAKGKIKLVKMNIDDHPMIAQQMRVQSIPAVFAFVDGRPLDGFMGALPESQVKQFVDRILADAGGTDDLAEALKAAEQALEQNDPQGAAEVYAAILQEDRQNVEALAGLAKCYLVTGDLDRAEQTLKLVPPDKAGTPSVAAVKAAIELARKGAGAGDLAKLKAKVDADPKDWQSRYDLAVGLAAKGDREDAVDHLLEIMRRNRQWNEDGARKQLVQLFEAWGPKDPATIDGRRRLSSILFS